MSREALVAVVGGSAAAVLAGLAWLIRDWRVLVVFFALLIAIAGLVLAAAAGAWP